MSIEKLFSHKAMRLLSRYAASNNVATQAVNIKSDGGTDYKTTGTAQCIVDGTFVASLAAQATISLASAVVCTPLSNKLEGAAGQPSPLTGKVVLDDGQFYMLVTTEADGTPHVYWAHDNLTAEDNAAPTLKIPFYNPDELTIGLVLYDNNDLGADMTIGTSIVSVDDDTWYQLIGPSLMPHVDFWDQN
jgi:hypothetical protein